jgi:hypothetical protein
MNGKKTASPVCLGLAAQLEQPDATSPSSFPPSCIGSPSFSPPPRPATAQIRLGSFGSFGATCGPGRPFASVQWRRFSLRRDRVSDITTVLSATSAGERNLKHYSSPAQRSVRAGARKTNLSVYLLLACVPFRIFCSSHESLTRFIQPTTRGCRTAQYTGMGCQRPTSREQGEGSGIFTRLMSRIFFRSFPDDEVQLPGAVELLSDGKGGGTRRTAKLTAAASLPGN